MTDMIMRAKDANRAVDHAVRFKPHRVGFLLTQDFALIAYAAAVEPLRAANKLSGRSLYTWCHISPEEDIVYASNGAGIVADYKVGDGIELDTLLVIAGGNPALFDHEPTFAWIRRLARSRIRLGGISGGPFILARAGVLAGYRCTVHWEHVPAFREIFPDLVMTSNLFEIDKDRVTCAGAIAALDMMLSMFTTEHGNSLASAVSDWFLHTQARLGGGFQRLSASQRYGVHNSKLVRVLEAMEQSIEEPLARTELACIAQVSVRQLDRLFKFYLGISLNAHYNRVRLDKAQLLLRQTELSVTEIAITSGFNNSSHFSRSYAARFGYPPRAERLSMRARTTQPELHTSVSSR